MTATVKTTSQASRPRKQIDQRKYGRLLAQTVPAVIRTEAECRRVESEIAKLLRKGDQLTPEEDRLLETIFAATDFKCGASSFKKCFDQPLTRITNRTRNCWRSANLQKVS